MKSKIIFVDDDPNILRSYKRLIGLKYNLDTALGGESALQMLAEKGPYAVVVSDMRMPGMNGSQFLSQVRKRWPNTVRMLLTGQADMNDTISVVNEGQIFRFLTKPCPPELFGQALDDALQQYNMVIAEKELLEKTLRGCIKLLTDIVSIVSPNLFSRSTRARTIATKIAKQLNLKNQWKIEIAALLSQIGCITAPSEILEKKYRGEPLTENETETFAMHIQTGRELLANIPRLEEIAVAIAFQDKNYDGSGFPAIDKRGGDIPLIARVLKVALDFDNHLTTGKSEQEAIDEMHNHAHRYDPEILSALKAKITDKQDVFVVRQISADEIEPGMILAKDLRTKSNLLLVAKRQEVSQTMKICIANFAASNNIAEPIKILEYRTAQIKQDTHDLVC